MDPLALWGDPVTQRRIWQTHDPYCRPDRLRAHGVPVTTHFYRGTHSPP
ncbi:hypothetical protein [Streptomyces rubiginosohelvolus]